MPALLAEIFEIERAEQVAVGCRLHLVMFEMHAL